MTQPYYLLAATVRCRALNGRRIPWADNIIDGLLASPLGAEGWKKSSNSILELKIPVEGADPATAEEGFITELKTLGESPAAAGIGELSVTFSCNTVVIFEKGVVPPVAARPTPLERPAPLSSVNLSLNRTRTAQPQKL